jgi:hypothetical protein
MDEPMRTDTRGITHVTADDPRSPQGDAHIASCAECQKAFGPKPKRRFNPWALLWVALVLVMAGFVGSAASHTSTTAAVGVPSAPPSATAPHTPVVLYQRSGSGEFTSDYFTTPAEWQIQWSYDCGADPKGLFAVVPHDHGPNVDEQGARGSDVSWSHKDPGPHYLSVFSTCNWTVKVIG